MHSSHSSRAFASICALLTASLLAAQEPAQEAPATSAGSAATATTATGSASATTTTTSSETPATGATATAGEPATATEEPPKEPQLVPGETSYEAGKVTKGERIAVEFTLENRGEADLLIRAVQPSCGCTVASFDRKIAPGKSGKVKAWLDTSSQIGDIVKYLTVTSNDPTTPRLQLAIKASVAAFVTASPSYARLLQVQGQPASTTSLTLWSDGAPPLEVLGVDSPERWIKATARPATDSERRPEGPDVQWRLEVSIDGDAPVGALDKNLIVRTNHPHQRTLEIPLSGFVRPVVQAVPGEVDFGKLGRVNDRRRFALKVYNFGPDPVSITGVTCNLSFATTSLHTEQDGHRYRIEIVLSDEAPKGKFEGELEITTSSDVVPKIDLPVRGRVD